MRELAADLGSKGFELLGRLVCWHWSKSRASCRSRHQPQEGSAQALSRRRRTNRPASGN